MKKKNLLSLRFKLENRKKSRFLQNNYELCIVHYKLFCTFAVANKKSLTASPLFKGNLEGLRRDSSAG